MNTEMTKAILDGHKTQTRRVIKIDTVMYDNPQILEPDSCVKFNIASGGCQNYSVPPHFENSKYQVGDVVWVREPASVIQWSNDTLKMELGYKADRHRVWIDIPKRFLDEYDFVKSKWIKEYYSVPNGCIKEMARIFLKITDVRVERLQDISDEERLKEGINPFITWEHKPHEKKQSNMIGGEFTLLWNKTAPKGYKWEDNPYVFVYEFERVENE